MECFALCVIGALIQVCFIITENRKKYTAAVVLKGCASLAFVALGVMSMALAADQRFARLVVIGLVLGAVGDVLLNLRFVFEKAGQKIFLAGIAAFLAGHIMYLAALIPGSRNLAVCLICGVLAAAALLWWIFSRVGKVKKAFKIFGIVYIGAIVLMTAVAVGRLISSPGSTGALLYVIGALLFTASDVIMILNTFGDTPRPSMRAANLSLYYLGQLLIALCLRFF